MMTTYKFNDEFFVEVRKNGNLLEFYLYKEGEKKEHMFSLIESDLQKYGRTIEDIIESNVEEYIKCYEDIK